MKRTGFYERNTFDAKKPYRIVSISVDSEVQYKITQPMSLWVFGYSAMYFDVCYWILNKRYMNTKYFNSKSGVDEFIKKEMLKQNVVKGEIVVYDSLK